MEVNRLTSIGPPYSNDSNFQKVANGLGPDEGRLRRHTNTLNFGPTGWAQMKAAYGGTPALSTSDQRAGPR